MCVMDSVYARRVITGKVPRPCNSGSKNQAIKNRRNESTISVFPKNIWYNLTRIVGKRLFPRKGGDAMSIYEALSLMIAFGTLVAFIMRNK
ncbi:putative holin-like toxin [Dialister sp.]|uniref:putative holin-like toxin n=1 Tax=Dialister sp. TaxID=1955814 RepID=UPI003FA49FCC